MNESHSCGRERLGTLSQQTERKAVIADQLSSTLSNLLRHTFKFTLAIERRSSVSEIIQVSKYSFNNAQLVHDFWK